MSSLASQILVLEPNKILDPVLEIDKSEDFTTLRLGTTDLGAAIKIEHVKR